MKWDIPCGPNPLPDCLRCARSWPTAQAQAREALLDWTLVLPHTRIVLSPAATSRLFRSGRPPGRRRGRAPDATACAVTSRRRGRHPGSVSQAGRGAAAQDMEQPDSASRLFCGRILSMVNADDVSAIILAQKNMLDRFEKTNETLLNFNQLSGARLQHMSERFLQHTRTLLEMKRDLDSVFRRIRTLKGKLARQHPEAFSYIPEASLLEDEDDDPIPPSTTTTIATSEQSTGSYGDNSSPDTASPSLSPGFEDLSPAALNGRRSPTEDGETPPPRPGQ